MDDSESGVVHGVYEVIPVPLNVIMTDRPYKTDAGVLIAGKCPISIWIRINELSAPLIDLATYRVLRIPIKRFWLTTTETSTDAAELVLSNELTIGLLGLGGNVSLVDNVGTYYDARAIDRLLADSTIVLLADGATYTGAQFTTDGYNKIIGSVFSNATGTLYVEQSQNGTNYDLIETIPYVGGVFTGGFSVEIVAPYARIRYTDTPVTAQTAFRLFAYLSTGA